MEPARKGSAMIAVEVEPIVGTDGFPSQSGGNGPAQPVRNDFPD
jgi:hypothetical protein